MDGALYGFTPQPNDINFINYIRQLYGNTMSTKGINLLDPFNAAFFHYNKQRSGYALLDSPMVSNTYVFMTRPELNWSFENINSIPYFKWVFSTELGKRCMAALTDPEYFLYAPAALNGPNGLSRTELQNLVSNFKGLAETQYGSSAGLSPTDASIDLAESLSDAQIDGLGDFVFSTENVAQMQALNNTFETNYKAEMNKYTTGVINSVQSTFEVGDLIKAKDITNPSKYTTPFIPMLQNSCTGLSGGAKDLNLENYQYESDYFGSNFIVPTGMDDLWSSGTLTTTHEDIIYGPVSTMYMLWIFYIHYVSRGYINSTRDHVLNRVLDYTCSIYEFVLGRDGRTIERFGKWTGCYPKSFGLSSQLEYSSTPDPEMLRKISITWDFNRYEPMDPRIFTDFNLLSESEWRYKLKTWEDTNGYNSVFDINKFGDLGDSQTLKQRIEAEENLTRNPDIWSTVGDDQKGISGKVPDTLIDGTPIDGSDLKYTELANNYWGGYPYIKNGREFTWVAPLNKLDRESEEADLY